MIVRNEEQNLPCCLESVRGIFDEMVIVDTGSTDRTKEIADSFGARVVDFAWIDDFAAARNVALENATGDYAFWLDADDVIEPAARGKLQKLIQGLRQGQKQAYVVRCVCDPSSDGSSGQLVVDHVRLFPLLKEVRWVYRVHEQILPALMQAKIPTLWTDVTVRHTGYAGPGAREKKRERDLRILLEELGERPNDAFVLFNIGTITFERQQWAEALDYFQRSLANLTASAANESLRRKLFGMLAWTQQILGNLEESLRICEEGLIINHQDAELWFRKAVAHRYRGEINNAEAAWYRILSLHRTEQFSSVDQGIYGHLTRRNLALIATERGNQAEAEIHWQAVLAECPGDADALKQLKQVAA